MLKPSITICKARISTSWKYEVTGCLWQHNKYQTVIKERDREIHTSRLYWFTHPWATSSPQKPLRISLCNQSQITTHTTPQRGDFESHKAYSPSLHQHPPQARITLTLQDFTISEFNYKKLSKSRLHLTLGNHRAPRITSWTLSKPLSNFGKTFLNFSLKSNFKSFSHYLKRWGRTHFIALRYDRYS